MNSKVLLIVPPVRLSVPPTRFPLGLAYLAASLERNGFDVSVLDLNIIRPSLKEEKALITKALHNIDVVGIGGMITMSNTIIRITDCIKELRPELPVMVGGPVSSHFKELLLKKSRIDVLVQGEGEKTGPQVASALMHQDTLHGIPGVAFLEHDTLVLTPDAGRIDDLDSLPIPAYHR